MGRMHIAHFETSAFAGQTARSERRQTALMGDFRQRIGLIHELTQLRRAKELAHRGGSRLCVDQVVRHDTVDFDRRHALADRPLHAQQANTILIFHQLADRTNPAIAEMINIVDIAPAVFHADHQLDDMQDVVLAQDTHRVGAIELQTRVHLHTTDRREVIALVVEEQALEQVLRRLIGRRLTRAHDPVNIDQRIFARTVFVGGERVADIRSDGHMIDRQCREGLDLEFHEGFKDLFRDLIAGFDEHFTRLFVDDVFPEILAEQLVRAHEDVLNARFLDLACDARRVLGFRFGDHLARLRIYQIMCQLDPAHALGIKRRLPAILGQAEARLVVEGVEDLLV